MNHPPSSFPLFIPASESCLQTPSHVLCPPPSLPLSPHLFPLLPLEIITEYLRDITQEGRTIVKGTSALSKADLLEKIELLVALNSNSTGDGNSTGSNNSNSSHSTGSSSSVSSSSDLDLAAAISASDAMSPPLLPPSRPPIEFICIDDSDDEENSASCPPPRPPHPAIPSPALAVRPSASEAAAVRTSSVAARAHPLSQSIPASLAAPPSSAAAFPRLVPPQPTHQRSSSSNNSSSCAAAGGFVAYMRGNTGGSNPFAGAAAAAAAAAYQRQAGSGSGEGGGGGWGGGSSITSMEQAQLRVLGMGGLGFGGQFIQGGGARGMESPMPLPPGGIPGGGGGGMAGMPPRPGCIPPYIPGRYPQASDWGAGRGEEGGKRPYGPGGQENDKRMRAEGKGGWEGGVEVKKEKEPRPIQATPAELAAAMKLKATTGMGLEEGLTALRVNRFNPEEAVKWYIEASQQNRMEMALVHHASIESEKANDEYRKVESARQEQLMREGDVLGGGDFKDSTLVGGEGREGGSEAVGAFLRRFCCLKAERFETEGMGDEGVARRRELVVKLLIKEKEAVRFYKHNAVAYMKALANRLDAAAAMGGEKGGNDGKDVLPLSLLEEEAEALESALTKYPEGNVGGVPAQFLKYSSVGLDLDQDGLEVVSESGEGGEGEEGAVSDGKEGGRRRSTVRECIEVMDD